MPSGGINPGSNPGGAINIMKYKKIPLLILIIVIAYIVFQNIHNIGFLKNISPDNYFIILVAGILYSFGFTAPFAVGLFVVLNPSSIILASIVGGIGSLITDLSIYNLTKLSFMDEFEQLQKEKFMKKGMFYFDKIFSKNAKRIILYLTAGILIASPLPDEMGVTLLSGLTSIKVSQLAILSFILNTVGILVILLISA